MYCSMRAGEDGSVGMRLCWRKSTKNLPHVHKLTYDQWTITELASVCMRHTFPQAQSAKTCPACLDCYKRSSAFVTPCSRGCAQPAGGARYLACKGHTAAASCRAKTCARSAGTRAPPQPGAAQGLAAGAAAPPDVPRARQHPRAAPAAPPTLGPPAPQGGRPPPLAAGAPLPLLLDPALLPARVPSWVPS